MQKDDSATSDIVHIYTPERSAVVDQRNTGNSWGNSSREAMEWAYLIGKYSVAVDWAPVGTESYSSSAVVRIETITQMKRRRKQLAKRLKCSRRKSE